jgi:thiol-disulfide isomerase/thioredoxin
MRFAWALAAILFATCVGAGLRADDETPKEESPAAESDEVDRYTVPKDADVPALMEFVKTIHTFRPKTRAEAVAHKSKARVALQDAARRILAIEKDTGSEAFLLAKTIEVGSEIRSLIAASEDERKQYMETVLELLKHKQAGRQQVGLAMNVADMLEQLEPALAVSSYKSFGEALAKSSNEEVALDGKKLTGAARRLELPGKPLKLAAKKVDGSKFDIGDLKGKVVLVDFWATWCGPCIAEIPNMKRMYQEYHDRGFEIVGLSIDEDRDDLDQFLESRKLPWIILHDERGWDSPVAVDYGIMGIPSMFLVGKDGKVIDIHARGEKLQELLAEQFPEKSEDEDKPKEDK